MRGGRSFGCRAGTKNKIRGPYTCKPRYRLKVSDSIHCLASVTRGGAHPRAIA